MWTRMMSAASAAGATTQPMRQPIIRCSIDTVPIVTTRSRSPGSAAGCTSGRPSKRIASIHPT